MNTKYRCCIFDLDGTLINTLEALTRTINLTLEEFGLEPVDQAHTRKFVGDGYKLFVERAFAFRGQQDPERIRQAQARYSQLFQENCLYHVEADPGIPHLLAFLKERGVRTAVLSNKADRMAGPVVEHYYPGVFPFIQGAVDGLPVKPDPTLLRRLMERMGAGPADTLFVGDSNVDIQTAKNGGLASCGVLWGFRTRAELEEEGASIIVETPQELVQVVLGHG